ncbi:hypothetical protein [uncultured Phenylobacterium sp.]|uniref:hypothetical protein n=1 Tax=uncultured Phenylobacterium sp. TaxID=349273 RepID=UPI0025D14DFC|nr:hypothetical protein [uncultured Phenylobacterium sp.]
MLRELLIAAAITVAAAPAWAADQAPRPVTTYKAPRAVDGHPSLDGVWTNVSMTNLERDPRWGDTLVLSEEKAAEIEGKNQQLLRLAAKNTDPNATVLDLPADCSGGRVTNCNYNAGWTDPGDTVMRVAGQPRNGYITIPADGRVPMRKGVAPSYGRALPKGLGPSDNPESRALGERCLLSFGNSSGPVMTPGLYNNMYQIVQTRDAVLINVEMVHDARIVRLDTRQHLPATLRPWMGDSIGWWEGETLVVETTNFHPEQVFRGASANLKVTERFTPVSPTRLHYGFWVEDPTVFAQAWGGEYEFTRSAEQVYEYACHEGNYGLTNILSGARMEDKTGVKTAPTNVDQRVAVGEEGEEPN